MIKINPVNSQEVEIVAEGQSFGTFGGADAAEAMEALHAEYPGMSELTISAEGFKATRTVVEKALELAGLDGLNAAKQQATGKVVF
jgi:hypothetical protein